MLYYTLCGDRHLYILNWILNEKSEFYSKSYKARKPQLYLNIKLQYSSQLYSNKIYPPNLIIFIFNKYFTEQTYIEGLKMLFWQEIDVFQAHKNT